jgi:hypothetical protein
LKLSHGLAPTGKSYDRLEMRTTFDQQSVVLIPESRQLINEQVRSILPPQDAAAVAEEFRGTLRAVHLDQDWLEVLSDGHLVHIKGLQDAVDDVIGPMVNKQVLVRAIRLSGNKHKFVDIETIE